MTDMSPLSPSAFAKAGVVAKMKHFLKMEAAGGIVLVLAAFLAIVIANTSLGGIYNYILNDVHFQVGFTAHSGLDLSLNKSVLHWINDGLMVIFFFLVGLEIKREFKEGQLSTRAQALLPFLGAVGGMIVPALIYIGVTSGSDPAFVRGWAIPSATDIAFTLGVLALLGSRVPLSLKILVTAIAVIDDLGAIVIIALFYTQGVTWSALMAAGACLMALILCNRVGVVRPAVYVLLGFCMWVAVLKSGVHATLAGVLTAMCIPMHDEDHPDNRPLDHLLHTLHPWVAFMILPLFAFANAGVSLAGMSFDLLMDPVVVGIALGLFIGKQVGIFGAIMAAIRLGCSPKPSGAHWTHIYGVSILCGIGFTMSLFIGALAFQDATLQTEVRLGVILGSILSAGVGYAILRFLTPSSR